MEIDRLFTMLLVGGAILLGFIVYKSLSKSLGFVTNQMETVLKRTTQIIDLVGGAAADVINPDSWKDKQAAFCCDVFTPEMIARMAQNKCLKCNPNCQRTPPGCLMPATQFEDLIKQCTGGKIAKPIEFNPGVLSCKGLVQRVDVPK